ncbi:MAG: Sec-independent protein translocase subunit TatB [Campylobacteraceae bacterium]|nr:Sec-independent protein translocase subunit TatB [Campylobacteraceae bacterium]
MFGMGFMEIFLIAIVAIIALGPDKLPTAMVEIAKFIKKFKSGVEDAKSTLDNELNINEMKEEAARYKAQIEDAKNTLNVKENMNLDLNNILNDDDEPSKEKVESKKEAKEDEKKEQVSLKEPKKKKKKDNSDKFKVNFDEEVKEEK